MNRNSVFITGDVTGDIYYSNAIQNGKPSPFLRMMVVIQGSSTNRPIPSIRVIAKGRRAEILEGFIQTGTRLAIEGHLGVRKHDDKVVIEIVCEHAEAIRYANWDRGYARIEELKERDANLLDEHGTFIDGLRNQEEEAKAEARGDKVEQEEDAELELELVSL